MASASPGRWISIVVVVAIAATGNERVDLLWGSAPFSLTPNLAAYVVLIATVLISLARRQFRLKPRWGFGITVVFVVLAIVSVLVNGASLTGLGRGAILAVMAIGAWLLVSTVVLTRRYDLLRLGACLGLAVFVLNTLAQVMVWLIAGPGRVHTVGPFNLEVAQLGSELLRVTGASLDPNRSCLVLAVFVVLLLAPMPGLTQPSVPAQVVAVAATLILAVASWSRTGLVAYSIILVTVYLVPLIHRLSRRTIIKAGLIAVAALGAALGLAWIVIPNILEHLVMTRLVAQPGDSASEHVLLLETAIRLVVENPGILIIGTGFGMSFLILEPLAIPSMANAGDHANFHSAYATALIEVGLVGLIAYVLLVFRPLLSRWFGVAIAVAMFGVLYQNLLDASNWLLIAIGWILVSATDHRAQRGVLEWGRLHRGSAKSVDATPESTADALTASHKGDR